MSKQIFSLQSCASAISELSKIANKAKAKPNSGQLELLTTQAAQIVAMLNDPVERTAIDEALAEVRRNRT